jgi:outer membrane protein OmpA-like peptidoglycan-associated protein
LKPIVLDPTTPLDLYEARNALRIAKWMGADKDAAESYQKAAKLLDQAEAYKARKAGDKPVSMTSREAAQTAEDARLIALKRQQEMRLAEERRVAAEREAQAKAATAAAQNAEAAAKAATDAEAKRRAQAEEQQRLEAVRRSQAEAERATAQALAARTKAEADLAAERAARERERVEADALRSRQAAEQSERAAQQAERAAQQAEREKQELRTKLVQQLNLILETRDTTRGLIVNMSDVLFDTGKYDLRPVAREKLARIAGIVLAHPGLMLEVEGHTDSVGTDEYNMQLSEKRASTVRDFLVQQGISSAITARGFGKSQPVASNDTPAGRQSNRRVEMIVSGDVIGTPINATSRSAR